MTCFADSRWWVSQGAGEIEGMRGRKRGGREGRMGYTLLQTCCLPAAAVELESYPQTQLSLLPNFHQSIKTILWKVNNIDLHCNCLMNSILIDNQEINKYYYTCIISCQRVFLNESTMSLKLNLSKNAHDN